MNSKQRLNSNIYKNIFPSEVMDVEYLEDLRNRTLLSVSEIKQDNHGFNVGDVITRRDGIYVLAIADDTHKTEKIYGVVTAVRTESIFTLMDSGKLPYAHLDFEDTTILYLSDKNPGKMCHYREIDNMTYIPIAVYTGNSIIINILDGATGAFLYPYGASENNTQDFENYTQAELDNVVNVIRSAL